MNSETSELERVAWTEYDYCAKSAALAGRTGAVGEPLPDGISPLCHELINEDPEAFQERVRATAYALAMERLDARRCAHCGGQGFHHLDCEALENEPSRAAYVHDHNCDEDCTPDEDNICTGCGVEHGDPCAECGGRGFHRSGCGLSDLAFDDVMVPGA